jgi:hypothetical protein
MLLDVSRVKQSETIPMDQIVFTKCNSHSPHKGYLRPIIGCQGSTNTVANLKISKNNSTVLLEDMAKTLNTMNRYGGLNLVALQEDACNIHLDHDITDRAQKLIKHY